MKTMDFYLRDVWNRALDIVRESISIDEKNFTQMFEGTRLLSLDENEAVILAPSVISVILMTPHRQVIELALETVLGEYVAIKVIREDELEQEKAKETITEAIKIPGNHFIKSDLNPEHTFADFVVGKSNMQAQVASLTCATNPGVIYNPLFIYGNSGLGKTHLLNAIGNHVKELFPHKQIGYISGLDFVEGVYQSIKNKKIDEFKAHFHDLDVLLVDDIQFIAGKEKTHEIFFSVFNDLVNNRKQVCITADRVPADIKGLEERIISRFNQGLNVNIETPEYETSINILKMKISNSSTTNQNIDDEVLSYIATNFSQDVRQLEGALTRLLFYSINFGPNEHISLKIATEAFRDQITENKNELTYSKIKKAVCDYYNVSKQQLNSKSRTKNIANARHIAMYLCRKLLDAPYKEIGEDFGKRDHSTVMNACTKVEQNIKSNPLYLKVINEIEGNIK